VSAMFIDTDRDELGVEPTWCLLQGAPSTYDAHGRGNDVLPAELEVPSCTSCEPDQLPPASVDG